MPVGKCEGHPLQRTDIGKKDFHKHPFPSVPRGVFLHI